MIASFYSYKGGVGRTQLCANTAAYLCFKKNKKVLLWDWDFEAPGLHFFFNKKNKHITKKGTIELLEEYVRLMRSKSGNTKEDFTFVNKDNIIELEEFTSTDRKGNTTNACIDLLPAGNLMDNFSRRVNDFNWHEFYDLLDGINFMELFKEEIKKLGYDYIFIDSRTGISDYSGICNIQLPDMNLFIMTANDQNYYGCNRIAKQIIDSEYVKKGFRKPTIMPILSRFDESNPKFDFWVTKFTKIFSYTMPLLDTKLEKEFTTDVFRDAYLKSTFLKYVVALSGGENILFTKEKQRFTQLSLEQEYINIAEFIQQIKTTGEISISDFINKDTWLDYAEIAELEDNKFKAATAYYRAKEIDKANELGGTSDSWYDKGIDYTYS